MNKGFYELRIYKVYPSKIEELLRTWKKNFPSISKYFNCLGVWTAISGDINTIYHIYYWENFEFYENNKKAFKKNMKTYIKKVKLMYISQESIILKDAGIKNNIHGK